MPDQRCEAVRRWLRQGDRAVSPAPPPTELAEHMAGCARCRGLLITVAAELMHIPAPGDALPCATCQATIDVYIDCERQHGVAVALRRYPQIWWHLWVCTDCAEVYQFTNALLDAEDAQMLPPITVALMPQRPMQPLRWPTIQLPRVYLHTVFAAQATLGTAWNGDDDQLLFAEEAFDTYHIALHIQLGGTTAWNVTITVTPPVAGWAVISLGATVYRALFDQHGAAIIREVPRALLSEHMGPDMLVTIEHDPTGRP